MDATAVDEVERCDWRDFLTVEEGTPNELIAALDEHFRHYAKVGSPCPGCGAILFGSMDDPIGMFTSTFEWGLVHGEGRCSECHWPATLYHFIHDKDGKEIAALRKVGLAAHPDFVRKAE